MTNIHEKVFSGLFFSFFFSPIRVHVRVLFFLSPFPIAFSLQRLSPLSLSHCLSRVLKGPKKRSPNCTSELHVEHLQQKWKKGEKRRRGKKIAFAIEYRGSLPSRLLVTWKVLNLSPMERFAQVTFMQEGLLYFFSPLSQLMIIYFFLSKVAKASSPKAQADPKALSLWYRSLKRKDGNSARCCIPQPKERKGERERERESIENKTT